MRIGIDAKWLFTGPPSGHVVVSNLVKHLLINNIDNDIILFLKKSDKGKDFPFDVFGKKIKTKYVWAGNNLISNVFVLAYWSYKLKIDVVLFQNFTSPFLKFKKVAYVHDALYLSYPEFYGIKEKIYLYPLKYLVKTCNRIITISYEEKKRLIAFKFGKEDKIDFVYHGVSPKFKPKEEYSPEVLINIKQKYNLPNNFLLYVGRLNVRKNIENLIKAISILPNKNITLVIVGKVDNKMFDLDQLILNLKISNSIIRLGFVPDEDLYVVYSLAHLFIFPSFAEGFGLPVLEAMAAGVPVLTSNVTSLPEVCSTAALYFDPHSPEQIANHINVILNDAELYNKKRIEGFERAKKFSWDKSAIEIIKYIEKV